MLHSLLGDGVSLPFLVGRDKNDFFDGLNGKNVGRTNFITMTVPIKMKLVLALVISLLLVALCGASALTKENDSTEDEHNLRNVGESKCGKNKPLNILLTNDDGFDVANIQTLFKALKHAGHNVLLVAPYSSQSGKSASVDNTGIAYTSVFSGTPLASLEVGATTKDSECGRATVGSPPLAQVAHDEYYVDGPPTLSVWYGLDVAGPVFFGPHDEDIDLVISGPNVGNNYGWLSVSSGTVGAAVTAMNRGIPAIALSAAGGGGRNDNDCIPTKYNSELIAALSLKVVDSVTCGDKVTLEPSTGLTVNIPSTKDRTLDDLSHFKFVPTEISVASQFGL